MIALAEDEEKRAVLLEMGCPSLGARWAGNPTVKTLAKMLHLRPATSALARSARRRDRLPLLLPLVVFAHGQNFAQQLLPLSNGPLFVILFASCVAPLNEKSSLLQHRTLTQSRALTGPRYVLAMCTVICDPFLSRVN